MKFSRRQMSEISDSFQGTPVAECGYKCAFQIVDDLGNVLPGIQLKIRAHSGELLQEQTNATGRIDFALKQSAYFVGVELGQIDRERYFIVESFLQTLTDNA